MRLLTVLAGVAYTLAVDICQRWTRVGAQQQQWAVKLERGVCEVSLWDPNRGNRRVPSKGGAHTCSDWCGLNCQPLFVFSFSFSLGNQPIEWYHPHLLLVDGESSQLNPIYNKQTKDIPNILSDPGANQVDNNNH